MSMRRTEITISFGKMMADYGADKVIFGQIFYKTTIYSAAVRFAAGQKALEGDKTWPTF